MGELGWGVSAPTDLRVEHRPALLGLTEPSPRLSWRLPEGAARQRAYRIAGRMGDQPWDTGWVASDRSLFVPYGGPPLVSRAAVRCAVRVRTGAGVSAWSEPVHWEMGLLDPNDWTAHWIGPAEGEVPPPGFRPAYHLRGGFTAPGGVVRARAYATAHGLYELFLNGERVGDAELAPGFTAYRSHLHVQTYDVTGLVRTGGNVLGAVLSDGWFRGRTSYHRLPDGFGDRTALVVQLHLDHEDGTTTVTGTNPGWRSAVGAVKAADFFDGVAADLRDEPAGWHTPGPVSHGGTIPHAPQNGLVGDPWSPVVLRERPAARLISSPAPPVRRLQELAPVSVTRPARGVHIVDFGQNVGGWVRLSDLGPRGTLLGLTHAEALTPDGGDVDTSSGQATLRWYEPPRGVQSDLVVSGGPGGPAFEPRHTRHGFRYLRVDGHPGRIAPGGVAAVAVSSDLPRTGWFRCSDARVERLHDIACWTYRNQACDIPMAEITRELAGWTDFGWNIRGARLVHDVSGLSAKWLADLAADQWPDGTVRNYAPDPLGPGSLTARFAIPHGQAGFGDAAVSVPWETWRAYGDDGLLARQYASMTAWVDRVARVARDERHPVRRAARPEPAPHEEFLWDTGYHFGEHLEPGPPKPPVTLTRQRIARITDLESFTAAVVEEMRARDHAAFATAYFHRSARLLSRIAGILGRPDDAERYGLLAESVRAAWQAEFITPDGALTCDTQATHLRALAYGLVPADLRARTTARLVELIHAAGTRPGTGLPTTHLLLPVLAANGHLDLAYELLLRRGSRSWMSVIDNGGTTFWEVWDGITPDGRTNLALNMPTRASVVEFLHGDVGGVRLDEDVPAYRRFTVAPRPGGGLTWAEVKQDSPYGRIGSAWRIEGGRFSLEVTVPPGTTAEVVLPDGTRAEVGPGVHAFAARAEPADSGVA
ncbi:family 78 glycoside hydrolase catalytic domain [Actinomadura sp. NEAU-AAG7]|uniref:family 78 glycoside hydrolase catalytic domain n=1 Tax=Actinomadura sp. NEAU-AAG7 TaxID=2839640 RepID=UPI001BE45C54|nr:family 78 glycoside hydrolase catalytic domain [Actinomadura sp. NEAU-AAG7]MBT2210123.1 family 78 glycoside hydrolase catalytic domain [Actinomadura sp. NEAU-AAG7]